MKKLISLCTVLGLLLSLAVPALAAEDLEPPLWRQYGFESREACVADWFSGDEAAYQDQVDGRLERQRWEETAMAEAIADFDAEEYWASDDCFYSRIYDSKEAFMENWLLETEEQFHDAMLEDWLDKAWSDYRQETQVARTRAELGAPAGQVGVMVDGTYVSFGAAAPEVVEGRTMVPLRPLIEALGGKAAVRDGGFVCTFPGGLPYSHVESVTFRPDQSSYFKNGHTYLPLRDVAGALGFDVLWDSTFQTAVVLRRDRIIHELDQNFTVLNRMLSALAQDPGESYKTAVEMDAKLTLLDSVNGDKRYTMDADVELLQSGKALNLTLTMDLSALLEMEELSGGMPAAEAAALRGTLGNLKVQLIYDGEGGRMYVKSAALSLLSDGQIPADGWIALPAAELDRVRLGGAATVGALLYETLLPQAEEWGEYAFYYEGMTTPALLYRDLREQADMAAAFIGDGCFRESGGYSVLRYGEEEYAAYLEAEYGQGAWEALSEFEQLDLELKIAKDGAAAFRVLIQDKDSGAFYYPVMLLDASGTISAAKLDMTLLFKMKNQFNLELRYTASITPTKEAPAAAPPAGASVLDPYGDWYGAGEEAAVP